MQLSTVWVLWPSRMISSVNSATTPKITFHATRVGRANAMLK